MEQIELLEETANWKSRDVKYVAGNWNLIKQHIPSFELQDFKESEEESINPYYQSVIRLPLTPLENRVPVGIVSNTYTLAQHSDVASICIGALADCGLIIDDLRCELGLSTLGEWMNFRAYFPADYDFTPDDGEPLQLRLECYNSVDASSRLIILFGWYRIVCSNGLVIGETVSELRDIHNSQMDLTKVPLLVKNAMKYVQIDRERMLKWESTELNLDSLSTWVDSTLSDKWGKLAAFRVFQICQTGHDAKYSDPFEEEKPSRKSEIKLDSIPGSPTKAKNLYDVGQALSWVATNRNKAVEKTQRQTHIPSLLNSLASFKNQLFTEN